MIHGGGGESRRDSYYLNLELKSKFLFIFADVLEEEEKAKNYSIHLPGMSGKIWLLLLYTDSYILPHAAVHRHPPLTRRHSL